MAYDTMARRSELVALDVADVTLAPDGSGFVLIRRSKTDKKGEGANAYLSRETVRTYWRGCRPRTSATGRSSAV
jgi:hypothetical protein